MKRFFVVMLVLTVALGVFAAGYKGFSERPAFERQPMGYAQQFPGTVPTLPCMKGLR
jgi:hypothetical protein